MYGKQNGGKSIAHVMVYFRQNLQTGGIFFLPHLILMNGKIGEQSRNTAGYSIGRKDATGIGEQKLIKNKAHQEYGNPYPKSRKDEVSPCARCGFLPGSHRECAPGYCHGFDCVEVKKV